MHNELTVGDLMEHLSGLPDDTPIRLAQQPAWPFENHLGAPLVLDTDAGQVVYLPEDGQVGYLSSDVAAELGWKA